jgi:uncharacterized protein (TIGR02996 family)
VLRTFKNGDRVWSIERRGKGLTIRHGKAAGKQQLRQRKLPSDPLAEREVRRLVRQKLNDGYRESTPPGSMPELDDMGQALTQAVVDIPADRAAHMALADWLSEQADVKLQNWGEFIRTQLALEDDKLSTRERKKLDQRAAELIDANQRDWLGEPLAGPLLRLKPMPMPRVGPYWEEEYGTFEYGFARGWLDRLVVPYLSGKLAAILARSASLRLLRELVILGTPDRGAPFAPLAGSANLMNVRALAVEFYLGQANPAPLVASLPRLEDLRVVLATHARGLLELPNLANLQSLSLAALERYPIDELASSPVLGRLRRLVLNKAELTDDLDDLPSPLRVDEVVVALRSPSLTSLAELTVNVFTQGDEGCAEIVRAGLLKRLEVLDLSFGDMTDEGARTLAGCPDLPRLKKLVVTGNVLSPAGVQRLRRTGVKVESRRQYRRVLGGVFDDLDF